MGRAARISGCCPVVDPQADGFGSSAPRCERVQRGFLHRDDEVTAFWVVDYCRGLPRRQPAPSHGPWEEVFLKAGLRYLLIAIAIVFAIWMATLVSVDEQPVTPEGSPVVALYVPTARG